MRANLSRDSVKAGVRESEYRSQNGIRLECRCFSFPFDVHSDGRVLRPVRIVLARPSHLFDMLHPFRELLEIAVDVEDDVDRRIDQNRLYSSLHDEPLSN